MFQNAHKRGRKRRYGYVKFSFHRVRMCRNNHYGICSGTYAINTAQVEKFIPLLASAFSGDLLRGPLKRTMSPSSVIYDYVRKYSCVQFIMTARSSKKDYFLNSAVPLYICIFVKCSKFKVINLLKLFFVTMVFKYKSYEFLKYNKV